MRRTVLRNIAISAAILASLLAILNIQTGRDNALAGATAAPRSKTVVDTGVAGWSCPNAFAKFSILPNGEYAAGITVGPDGNLWFTVPTGNKIGKITTSAAATEFPVPTPSSAPGAITLGPDKNLWFTENGAGKLGKITTAGAISEYAIPGGGSAVDITAGPGGSLWFTRQGEIDKVSTAGSFTQFPIPGKGSHHPISITAGPDGNIWFTEMTYAVFDPSKKVIITGQIGKVTPAGAFTQYTVPSAKPFVEGSFGGITAGPDGNLWFAENALVDNKIAKITTSGVFKEYPLPTPASGKIVGGITAGPDGNLWFTEYLTGIATITTAGSLMECFILGRSEKLTFGPDGNIWYTGERAIPNQKAGDIVALIGPPPKCEQLSANIRKVIFDNGPPFTVAAWLGIKSQLGQCVRQGHLTQATANALITEYENWLKTRFGR